MPNGTGMVRQREGIGARKPAPFVWYRMLYEHSVALPVTKGVAIAVRIKS
jgi:hypothetical protein